MTTSILERSHTLAIRRGRATRIKAALRHHAAPAAVQTGVREFLHGAFSAGRAARTAGPRSSVVLATRFADGIRR